MNRLQSNKYTLASCLIISFLIGVLSFELCAHTSKMAELTIPTNIPGIWKTVDEENGFINQALERNQLESIHEHAFAIRDLVYALSTTNSNLSDAQKKTLQTNIGYVELLATRLDKTGDAHDKAGSQANWDKLKKILDQLRALYATPPSQ